MLKHQFMEALRAELSPISEEELGATLEYYAEMIDDRVESGMTDANGLDLNSSSGDISGTLLSEKIFVEQTSSGDLNCPVSSPDCGICEIRTSSGDISFQIVK